MEERKAPMRVDGTDLCLPQIAPIRLRDCQSIPQDTTLAHYQSIAFLVKQVHAYWSCAGWSRIESGTTSPIWLTDSAIIMSNPFVSAKDHPYQGMYNIGIPT